MHKRRNFLLRVVSRTRQALHSHELLFRIGVPAANVYSMRDEVR
jgi:hypothetical protein